MAGHTPTLRGAISSVELPKNVLVSLIDFVAELAIAINHFDVEAYVAACITLVLSLGSNSEYS